MDNLRFAHVSLSFTCEGCRESFALARLGEVAACPRCGREHRLSAEGFATLGPLLAKVAASGSSLAKKAYGIGCTAERAAFPCEACGSALTLRDGAIRCSACDHDPGFAPAPAMPGLAGMRVAASGKEEPAGAEPAVFGGANAVARAVTCPTCGSSLPKPASSERLVTCTYCQTLCHLDVTVAAAEEEDPVLVLAFAAPIPKAERAKPKPETKKRAPREARPRREPVDTPREYESLPPSPMGKEGRAAILALAVAVALGCFYLMIAGPS